MDIHHQAWLDAHPARDADWLSERLMDGFDVHHIDGDCTNNAPENLVLIEHGDHMALHGTGGNRLECVGTRSITNAKLAEIDPDFEIGRRLLELRSRAGAIEYRESLGLRENVARRLRKRAMAHFAGNP